MDVIRKLVIEVVNFEMEELFGSCLVCFVITFVWNWMFTWRDSKMFGTGYLRGMLINLKCSYPWSVLKWRGRRISRFSSGWNPHMRYLQAVPLSGGNLDYGVGVAFASAQGISHMRSCFVGLWEGKIPTTELRPRVGKSHRDVCRMAGPPLRVGSISSQGT